MKKTQAHFSKGVKRSLLALSQFSIWMASLTTKVLLDGLTPIIITLRKLWANLIFQNFFFLFSILVHLGYWCIGNLKMLGHPSGRCIWVKLDLLKVGRGKWSIFEQAGKWWWISKWWKSRQNSRSCFSNLRYLKT